LFLSVSVDVSVGYMGRANHSPAVKGKPIRTTGRDIETAGSNGSSGGQLAKGTETIQ
jgi:hypothetical protein